MRPASGEYLPYFERYIALVPGEKVVPVLVDQLALIRGRLGALSDEQAGHRYAPGKWSVREVLGHLVDTERVFGLRALWFARGETTPLPSFEQDLFAREAQHEQVPLTELVEEFCALRQSHILMFNHLPRSAWARVGTASGHAMTPRAAAFIMAGHVQHHLALLQELYGV